MKHPSPIPNSPALRQLPVAAIATIALLACNDPVAVRGVDVTPASATTSVPVGVSITDVTPRVQMSVAAIISALTDASTSDGTLIVGVKEAGAVRGVGVRGAVAPVAARRTAETAIRASFPDLPVLAGVARPVPGYDGARATVDTVFVSFITVRPPISEAFLGALLLHPNVDYIEPNHVRPVLGSVARPRASVLARTTNASMTGIQQRPWGVDTVRAPSVWASYDGSGVNLSIVDTGVDASNSAPFHPDLTGSWRFTNYVEPKHYFANACTDDTGNASCYWEAPYHGTGVYGAARARQDDNQGSVGVAPNPTTRVNFGKVTYVTTSGDTLAPEDDYATAVTQLSDTIRTYHVPTGTWKKSIAKVGVTATGYTGDGTFNAIHDAFNFAYYQRDVLWFSFAGNDPSQSQLVVPARFAEVVAVGALEQNLSAWLYSQTDPKIEFAAPGVDLRVSWNRLDDDAGLVEFTKLESGTSFAAPIAAGVAILARQKFPSWTASMTRSAMQSYARDILDPGRDPISGYGIPDVLCLFNQTTGCAP